MAHLKFFLILLLFSTAVHSSPGGMDVTIEYSPFRDSICGLFKGYEIKDAWREEPFTGRLLQKSMGNRKLKSRLLSRVCS